MRRGRVFSYLQCEMKELEHIIIRQLRAGDEEAYRYLFDRHYAVLCRFANEWVGDPFLAETIVGDVIFHLWEIRDTLEIDTSLRAYLMRAVRNRCYNHLSSESKKRETPFSALAPDTLEREPALSLGEHPLGLLLERELEGEIIRSIERLGDECKRVFKKSRFERKRNEEIAVELGISVNTVKYHIKMALARLRQDLGKYLLFLIFVFILY